MTQLDSTSSLSDVAFAVCTALHAIGDVAVLTGGSAATFYAPEAYQSLDADFVLRFGARRFDIDIALAKIGYRRSPQHYYEHAHIAFTVEFPPGPLSIGRDLIDVWTTVNREDERLNVLCVTDCVRDRFLHFYAWGDGTALRAAVAVARTHRREFDEAAFRAWAEREHEDNRAYDLRRVDEFFRRLHA